MGIFDKIGDSIVETGQEIRKMADQNSLQNELRKTNKELESLVYQIGLELISNEPELCAQKCPESYSQLVDAREQARILRNQISLMNVMITCPGCGRMIKGATQFCVYCGSKLPDPGMEQAVCAGCGAPLKQGASFCTNCGRPVE